MVWTCVNSGWTSLTKEVLVSKINKKAPIVGRPKNQWLHATAWNIENLKKIFN